MKPPSGVSIETPRSPGEHSVDATVTVNTDYSSCGTCLGYLARRIDALEPHVERRAAEIRRSFWLVLHGFLTGVHDRQLAGLSLATNPESEAA